MHIRPFRSFAIGVIGVVTLVAAVAVPAGASGAAAVSGAHRPRPARPVVAGSTYLALGDSVTFGYRESANLPTPDYLDQASFVGYPEDVGSALGLRVVNPSCPGETSASLINDTAPSYACETNPGYRTDYPLHVSYAGSQLHFAETYLEHHRNVRLVSLLIGANDTFLCEATTTDNCASELPTVLAAVSKNVRTILSGIRHVAGYRGQLVVLDYYDLNYADPTGTAGTVALNNAIRSSALGYRVRFADAFAAFDQAAAQAGGNSCTAGLLTELTTGGCGVHPSVAGQALLANVVEAAIRK